MYSHACRDVSDGLIEMECTLEIDFAFFEHGKRLSYKYLVHSHRTESDTSSYEFLHGAPGGKGDVIINRSLLINDKNQGNECTIVAVYIRKALVQSYI